MAATGDRRPKVQHFSSYLPAGLVWVQVATSALIGIAVPCVWFALRDRGRVLEPDEKGGTPAKVTPAAHAPLG